MNHIDKNQHDDNPEWQIAVAGPDWIRDAYRLSAGQARSFLRTALDFTLHPCRFSERWIGAGRVALNPIGFLASSAAILGPIRSACLWLLGFERDPVSLWVDLLNWVGPFIHYMAVGILCHLALRLLGSRRRASDSVAMAVYAGGGPAAATEILVWILSAALYVGSGNPALVLLVLNVGLGVAFSVFCFALGSSLGTLHQPRWWHMMIAFTLAFAVTGLVFGAVDPAGSYGMHWILALFDREGGFRPYIGLGI